MKSILVIAKGISRLLTYDFCPWANDWVYWAKTPVASLAFAAVAALACAIFVKPVALIAFGAVLLVIGLGYVWPVIAIRGLQSSLTFRQRQVTEGDSAVVVVRVENRWPWPVWGLEIHPGFGERGGSVAGNAAAQAAFSLARVPGWTTSEFEWPFNPLCRGEYPIQAPLLTTGFPFGLRMATRSVAVLQNLIVWPQVIPLETLLDAAETRPSDDCFSDHRSGESGDASGTRLFRDGDSLRRVHWSQTARQGKLIVCERQAPIRSAIRVVFDSHPRLHRGAGPTSTLEWSIRIAASVCLAYHRENASVECCFGHETIPLKPGHQGKKMFLDALARWKSCDHDHASCSAEATGNAESTGGDGPCQHQHAGDRCHRIHHHNCGVFQLTITTDIGLEHRTEHRHVHGDQRMVVLKSSAFESDCTLCGERHQVHDRLSIVLDRPGDVAADFRHQWRHVCHAG